MKDLVFQILINGWKWEDNSFISPNNNNFKLDMVIASNNINQDSPEDLDPSKKVDPINIDDPNDIDVSNSGLYVDYRYDDADNYVMDRSTGYIVSSINYPQTHDLKWKILYTANNTLVLVSDQPTNGYLTFTHGNSGSNYNNGVNIINSICRAHYSNSSYSKGISIRNLNFNDITNIITNAEDIGSYTYETTAWVPSAFLLEKGCIIDGLPAGNKNCSDEFDNLYVGKNLTRFSGSIVLNYYPYGIADRVFDMNFKNDKVKSAISSSDYYFLSSRSICQNLPGSNVIEFGLMFIYLSGGYIGTGQGYNTFNYGYNDESRSLRPVVILDLDYYTIGNEDGTINNPKSITKKY